MHRVRSMTTPSTVTVLSACTLKPLPRLGATRLTSSSQVLALADVASEDEQQVVQVHLVALAGEQPRGGPGVRPVRAAAETHKVDLAIIDDEVDAIDLPFDLCGSIEFFSRGFSELLPALFGFFCVSCIFGVFKRC